MTLKPSCEICNKVKEKNYKIVEEVLGKYLPHLIENITGIEINTLQHTNTLVCEDCAICIIHANVIKRDLYQVFAKKIESAGEDAVQTLKRKAAVEEKLKINGSKKIRSSDDGVGASTIENFDVVRISCGVCDYDTVSPKLLQTHLLMHNLKTSKLYKCGVCFESYLRPRNLVKHFHMVHSDKTPTSSTINRRNTICIEKDAELSFDKKISENAETETTPTSKKKNIRSFKCDICNYSTDVISGFKLHLTKVHDLIKPKVFSCKLCELSYRNQAVLKEHAMEVHQQSSIRKRRVSLTKNDRSASKTVVKKNVKVNTDNNPNNSIQTKLSSTMQSYDEYDGTKKVFEELIEKDMNKYSPSKNPVSNKKGVIKLKSPIKNSSLKTDSFDMDKVYTVDESSDSSLEESAITSQLDRSGIFKCDDCSYETFNDKEYRTHLFKNHDIDNDKHFGSIGSLQTKVGLSNRILDEQYTLSPILTPTKTLNKKKFKCSQCSESFQSKANLNNHILDEHGSLSFTAESIKIKSHNDSIGSDKYPTNTSDNIPSDKKLKSFQKIKISQSESVPVMNNDTLSNGNKNISKIISSTKEFICNVCEYRCKSEKQLAKHLQSKHQIVGSLSSDENILKIGIENNDLEKNLKQTNTEERKINHYTKLSSTQNDESSQEDVDFWCAICEKDFSVFSKLRRHMEKRHPNVERFSCKHCSKTTKSQEKYLIHIERCRQRTH